MTTTMPRPPTTRRPAPRPPLARSAAGPPGAALGPAVSPAARPSLGDRCRRALLRVRRFLLTATDDCPPILLYYTNRS
jgi:hypothetical protein